MTLIKSIKINNLLSFGDDSPGVELKDLNVLIGPNGSGKSNFVSVLELLADTSGDMFKKMKYGGGGVHEWLWKGSRTAPEASISFVMTEPKSGEEFEYSVDFVEILNVPNIARETIQSLSDNLRPNRERRLLYNYDGNGAILQAKGKKYAYEPEDITSLRSILNQVRDPARYPDITHIGEALQKIRSYRYWVFGPVSQVRERQRTDSPGKHLLSDLTNLGLALNNLKADPKSKRALLKYLSELHPNYDDFGVNIVMGAAEIFLHEGDMNVPITRLSDGTLRYLCLLAILLDPEPPPLICIEEPELGFHPDILPTIAELLVEASKVTQLIVTTHSDILVDSLGEHPEAVIVCEKDHKSTVMRRLDKEELKTWLEDYSLGNLWRSGEIGGNRW